MTAGILQVGVDHHLAPLEVRERLALDADGAAAVAKAIRAEGWVGEAAVISTCNRTELYVATSEAAGPDLVLDALLRHMPNAPDPFRRFYD